MINGYSDFISRYHISMSHIKIITSFAILLISLPLSAQLSPSKDKVNDSLNHTEQTLNMGRASQVKVNQLASETDRLLDQYQALLKKSEYQKSYNQELRTLQGEQLVEIASLEQQIKDIIITKQQLLPLLRQMVNTLEQFVKLDLPFRKQQRLTAVDKLTQLLASSSVSISEKYRRVMEMYQAENDYNYDLEVYRDHVQINEDKLSVQILRIGRSNLYFQTMDTQVSGIWHHEQKNWQILDDTYQLNIRKAMRIASKKAAPELLELPVTLNLDNNAELKGAR